MRNSNIQAAHPFATRALKDLFLDELNPRFGATTVKCSQEQIIERLASEKNLGELIQSFKENGYYKAEPLLIANEAGRDKVLEGNRRLAALKILTNPHLAKKYGYETEHATLSPARKNELINSIPVIPYSKRQDLWSYLGFRHIKGAMPWDPYNKALYILDMHENNGLSLSQIALKIGDKNATVYKMFNGIRVLKQAEDEGFVAPGNSNDFAFSHLYTIIGYTNTRKFLGIKLSETTELKRRPVSAEKIKNLKLLVEFLYGDVKGIKKPVIYSQNPDLRRLDKVLVQKRALNYLVLNHQEPDALENAFLHTDQEDEMLESLIVRALNTLKKASGNLHLYKGDDRVFKDMCEIKDLSEDMCARMTSKRPVQKSK